MFMNTSNTVVSICVVYRARVYPNLTWQRKSKGGGKGGGEGGGDGRGEGEGDGGGEGGGERGGERRRGRRRGRKGYCMVVSQICPRAPSVDYHLQNRGSKDVNGNVL